MFFPSSEKLGTTQGGEQPRNRRGLRRGIKHVGPKPAPFSPRVPHRFLWDSSCEQNLRCLGWERTFPKRNRSAFFLLIRHPCPPPQFAGKWTPAAGLGGSCAPSEAAATAANPSFGTASIPPSRAVRDSRGLGAPHPAGTPCPVPPSDQRASCRFPEPKFPSGDASLEQLPVPGARLDLGRVPREDRCPLGCFFWGEGGNTRDRSDLSLWYLEPGRKRFKTPSAAFRDIPHTAPCRAVWSEP